jgi:DNA-3-methyladenine glycosylase
VSKVIPLSYYKNQDVLLLGKDLLGKVLCTRFGCGVIAETESYMGPEDKASHAYNMRRTKRNEIMYASGGRAYVYICYGIHHLVNIVTGPRGLPHAVLIRAIVSLPEGRFLDGPGRVTKALGITKAHHEMSLDSNDLWLEDRKIKYTCEDIEHLPRVGIEYAKEFKDMPWRFRLKKSALETIRKKSKTI